MASYEVLESYGITLRRLTADKIELVRRWRNDPSISQYMEYREHITAEQQKAWFARINNDHNFYFIVEVEGKEIGCINVRDVDFVESTGEGGIFIWDEDIPPLTVIKSILALNDFCFDDLKLHTMKCHMLRDNKRAIRLNLSFGYVICEGQEEVYNQAYTLTRERYEKAKARMKRFL